MTVQANGVQATATKQKHDSIPYDDFLDRVIEETEKKKVIDRFGSLPRFRYVPNHKVDDKVIMPHLMPFKDDAGEISIPNLELLPVAHRHLCGRLNVQESLLNRLPAKLSHDVVNTLIQNNGYDKELMIRTVHDNKVRALMSKSYTPFDDVDLFTALQPYMKGAMVRFSDNSDIVTHVRVTWPETRSELKPGDIVESGIHISNSEVGYRSVVVQAVVVRLICTNGMLSSKVSGGFRHVGDPEALKGKVVSTIEEAKYSTETLTAKFRASLTARVDEPLDVMESFSKDGGLSQDQFKRTLERYAAESEAGGAVFDMVNAFTREAQEQDTAEERYIMEGVGAKMLNALV
jgi:hypothetical protein